MPADTLSDNEHFELERFVLAQSGSYEAALQELHEGRKRSHWMWFIFPQIAGLGHSAMAQRYAVSSAAEARQYLQHPILGPRLTTCAEAVLAVTGRSAHAIFGSPDDLKLCSCMTLFAAVTPPDSVFAWVLARYFNGEPDEHTLRRL